MHDDEPDDLYHELERRALFDLPEEEETGETLDLVDVLTGEGADKAIADLTLSGYIEKHNRPPAFEGVDGQPYTVAVDTEATDEPDRPYAAFFVFIRWAATGAGIMGHVETRDVAWGDSDEQARAAAQELTLYEIKAELDAAIRNRAADLED
jgi:hypothetical protein